MYGEIRKMYLLERDHIPITKSLSNIEYENSPDKDFELIKRNKKMVINIIPKGMKKIKIKLVIRSRK